MTTAMDINNKRVPTRYHASRSTQQGDNSIFNMHIIPKNYWIDLKFEPVNFCTALCFVLPLRYRCSNSMVSYSDYQHSITKTSKPQHLYQILARKTKSKFYYKQFCSKANKTNPKRSHKARRTTYFLYLHLKQASSNLTVSQMLSSLSLTI